MHRVKCGYNGCTNLTQPGRVCRVCSPKIGNLKNQIYNIEFDIRCDELAIVELTEDLAARKHNLKLRRKVVKQLRDQINV